MATDYTQRPSSARIYDALLGGSHNFAADREAAQKLLAAIPYAAEMCRINRAFLASAVRFMVDAGVDQFLDIGSGIPTAGNVHEVAQGADPSAKVVYVDIDRLKQVNDAFGHVTRDAVLRERAYASTRMAARRTTIPLPTRFSGATRQTRILSSHATSTAKA